MTRRSIVDAADALQAVETRKDALEQIGACCSDYLDALAEDPEGDDRNVDLRAGILTTSIMTLYAVNAKQ